MKTLFYFLFITIVISSCKKQSKEIIPPISVRNTANACNNCPTSYNLRSQLYASMYNGTLSRGCLYEESYIRLDKYEYLRLCVNPNNKYEIAFMRREFKGYPIALGELYKYNFCTHTLTLLTTKAFYDLDWSTKGWIIFTGKNSQLWKIKGNGDSLTQLTNTSGINNAAKWSPDGTKYIWNNNKVASENGTLLYTLATDGYPTTYEWKNNETVYRMATTTELTDPSRLFEINIKTNTATEVFTFQKNGDVNIRGRGNSKLYIVTNDALDGTCKLYQYNTLTDDTNLIYKYYQSNLAFNFVELYNNRIIMVQLLQDTFTNGNICKLNLRRHIAISNMDGTNERQVLLPE